MSIILWEFATIDTRQFIVLMNIFGSSADYRFVSLWQMMGYVYMYILL